MKKYFNFYNSSVVLYGEMNSVLYDFKLNKIYHLQSIETQIVKAIFEGTEIDKIKSEFESVIVENLLGIFEEKELGEYYKNFIPHEPFRVGSLNSNSIEKITLDNIFYELPCKCENNCSHCFLPKTGVYYL